MEPRPFVKWAGGKAQLLPDLIKYRPRSFRRYIEPFVGGGALLFALDHRPSLINDLNEELINCYIVIRDSPEELIEDLFMHKNEKDYFYQVREKNPAGLTQIERASRFIFLNRTCFNGLYRVNKKNQFNTPFGSYKNPKIANPELIVSVSDFLKPIDISSMDFEEFLRKHAKKDDFIYLDPPYHPRSEYSDFKRYTATSFERDEQMKLANLFRELTKRGCNLLLSNSYTEFVLDLYSDYHTEIVQARRNINKNSYGRGPIKEVLVMNYGTNN